MTTKEDLARALVGHYHTPTHRRGEIVTDAIRGEVIVTKTSDAPILWPYGRRPGRGASGLIVYGDLLVALKTESALAICHHWGITPQVVSKWRGLLGIDQKTPGALRLRQKRIASTLPYIHDHIDYKSPQRSEKIAAARKGKPRPRHVIEAMRAANTGGQLSEDHRRKLSEASRRRRARPPKAGRPWTAEEDDAIRTLSAADAVQATGRSLFSVYSRRSQLGVPDGRRRFQSR